jgi:hypothetical protein
LLVRLAIKKSGSTSVAPEGIKQMQLLKAQSVFKEAEFYDADGSRPKKPTLLGTSVSAGGLGLRLVDDWKTAIQASRGQQTEQVQNGIDDLKAGGWSLTPEGNTIVDIRLDASTWESDNDGIFDQKINEAGKATITLLINRGRGTTAAHFEESAATGFATLLQGEKVWYFWKPGSGPHSNRIGQTSKSAGRAFGVWSRMPDYSCVQRAGQKVAIPAGWWHEVVTLSQGAILLGALRLTAQSIAGCRLHLTTVSAQAKKVREQALKDVKLATNELDGANRSATAAGIHVRESRSHVSSK